MAPLIFRTTLAAKMKFFIIALMATAIVYLILCYWNEASFVPIAAFWIVYVPGMYLIQSRKYTITNSAFVIKQGVARSNFIPWDCITRITLTRKMAFRVDYIKKNGKIGFHIVDRNVDVESMLNAIKRHCPHCFE